MPNTFISLEVPRGDGVGTPIDTALTGHPKTFVLAGAVRAGTRYVVEGSNDGGATWDILVDDDDGTQVFFTSGSAGAKSADCIVGKVRVRAVGGPLTVEPPSITMGAPPATGPGLFARLDVPLAGGLGAPFDLGLSAGPLKTFTARGTISPSSRYTILASMDGVQFDEVMLFTADQQGARSKEVMCRFVRVARAGSGPTPVMAVGAEGLPEFAGGSGTSDLTIASEAKLATTNNEDDELLAEYLAPLGYLPGAQLSLTLSALARRERPPGSEEPINGAVRVRLGGTPGLPDGEVIATMSSLPEQEDITTIVRVPGFTKPAAPATLVKVVGVATRGRVTVRGFVLWFQGQ